MFKLLHCFVMNFSHGLHNFMPLAILLDSHSFVSEAVTNCFYFLGVYFRSSPVLTFPLVFDLLSSYRNAKDLLIKTWKLTKL